MGARIAFVTTESRGSPLAAQDGPLPRLRNHECMLRGVMTPRSVLARRRRLVRPLGGPLQYHALTHELAHLKRIRYGKASSMPALPPELSRIHIATSAHRAPAAMRREPGENLRRRQRAAGCGTDTFLCPPPHSSAVCLPRLRHREGGASAVDRDRWRPARCRAGLSRRSRRVNEQGLDP